MQSSSRDDRNRFDRDLADELCNVIEPSHDKAKAIVLFRALYPEGARPRSASHED